MSRDFFIAPGILIVDEISGKRLNALPDLHLSDIKLTHLQTTENIYLY